MEPSITPKTHKTNVPALLCLGLVTLIIVGLFFTMKPNIEISHFEIEPRNTARTTTPQSDEDAIESDLDSAVLIDNSKELESIDKEF